MVFLGECGTISGADRPDVHRKIRRDRSSRRTDTVTLNILIRRRVDRDIAQRVHGRAVVDRGGRIVLQDSNVHSPREPKATDRDSSGKCEDVGGVRRNDLDRLRRGGVRLINIDMRIRSNIRESLRANRFDRHSPRQPDEQTASSRRCKVRDILGCVRENGEPME